MPKMIYQLSFKNLEKIDYIQYVNFDVISPAGGSKNNLHLYLVYRSPNSPQANNEKLHDLIKSIPDNSIILGDFNMPGVNWNDEPSRNTKFQSFVELCD